MVDCFTVPAFIEGKVKEIKTGDVTEKLFGTGMSSFHFSFIIGLVGPSSNYNFKNVIL